MEIGLKENNGKSKYALTCIYTVGYIVVCCLGILFNGEVFFMIFTPLTIMQTLIVSSLFERKSKQIENKNNF